jgi:hypothetical protein
MTGQQFFAWLTQPSTIKAAIVLAGLFGLRWQPDKMSEILQAVGILYAGVGAFYDQAPRKPAEPVVPAEPPLTEARFRELLAEAKAKKQPPQG